jgi:hypothetical protein
MPYLRKAMSRFFNLGPESEDDEAYVDLRPCCASWVNYTYFTPAYLMSAFTRSIFSHRYSIPGLLQPWLSYLGYF